jgi:hypothetical protein
MSPFPSIDQDLAELERFLAADLPAAQARDPVILELRQRAERLALRLGNPVRVAIAGLPAAGKSTLAAFLAGQSYPPPRTRDGRALPVILRYGQRPESIAGWWSGIEIPERGIDIEAAAVHRSDYIELRLPNPVLQFISFLDVPGLGDWAAQKEQMRWIGNRADVVLWCTRAAEPWIDDEWQLWALVPRRVQALSLLVVTQTDLAPDRAGLGAEMARLANVTHGQFANTVSIATRAALAAAPSGRVVDTASWEASGGRAMVGAVITAARAVRMADIAAARELLAAAAEALGLVPKRPAPTAVPTPEEDAGKEKTPAESRRHAVLPGRPVSRVAKLREVEAQVLAETNGQPDSDGTAPQAEATGAPPPAAAPVAARPAPGAVAGAAAEAPALLRLVAGRAEDLIGYASAPAAFKDWEFMSRITELGDELSAMTISSRALRPEAAWIKGQVEDALVALSLLQMEQGERPCEDAAVVVLQLARDLAWAAAPEAG